MSDQSKKLLLTLLFVGVLMGALDLAIIGPALPAIKAEFGMPDRQLAILLNAYVLCQLIGTPLLAKLSDRFGPRAIYILSISIFAAGSVLLVVADSAGALFAGRALQGFGAGGIFPVATAVIATELPDKERGPALGILGVVFGLAFLLGPILGGILLQFAWQWLFLINVPIAALLIFGAVKLLPAGGSAGDQPFDYAGTALLATGLTTILGVQAFIIVGGVIKVVPLTGITLPFVSYGGSSLLSNYIALAILIRLSDASARRLGELPDDPTPRERWAAWRLRRSQPAPDDQVQDTDDRLRVEVAS